MVLATLSDIEQQALAIAREHAHAAALSSFAYDVVFGKLGGKRLQTGEKLTARRARKRGVNQQIAQTELGNVLKILGRGARSEAEWALLGAFSVRGFADGLGFLGSAAGASRIEHFIDGVIWIELNSACRPSHFVRELLTEDERAAVYAAIAEQALAAEKAAQHDDLAVRALNAARLAFLQRDDGPSAVRELARLHEGESHRSGSAAFSLPSTIGERPAIDALRPKQSHAPSATPAWTSVSVSPPQAASDVAPRSEKVASGADHDLPDAVLEGRLGRAPAGPVGQTLRVLTGWALLQPALSFLSWLIGWRRPGRSQLEGAQLRLQQERRIFGVRYFRSEEVIPLSTLSALRLSVRVPLLGYLLGLAVLCVAAYSAGVIGVNGLQIHSRALWLTAVSIIALGIGADILLASLASTARRKVVCELRFGRRVLCLHDVDLEAAQRFRDALEARFAEPVADVVAPPATDAPTQTRAEAKTANVL